MLLGRRTAAAEDGTYRDTNAGDPLPHIGNWYKSVGVGVSELSLEHGGSARFLTGEKSFGLIRLIGIILLFLLKLYPTPVLSFLIQMSQRNGLINLLGILCPPQVFPDRRRRTEYESRDANRKAVGVMAGGRRAWRKRSMAQTEDRGNGFC